MIMKDTSFNSAICAKTNLHAAPPQLLKASIAKCCATSTLTPDVLRSTKNALNFGLRHTSSNPAQLVRRNRMGKHEEARKI